jgi:hypothetical protein
MDNRSVIIALEGNVANQKKGREKDETKKRCEKVKPSLDLLLKSVHPIIYIGSVSIHSQLVFSGVFLFKRLAHHFIVWLL